jgi:carbamoyl-phosphate synthase large subunit
MRTLRILFTSAGRRVELINCFRAAAARLELRAEIHACDLAPDLSAACLVADASFAAPRCTDVGYIPLLLRYCEQQQIDLLVPTIDTELPVLSRSRHLFLKAGTEVHVSSPDTIATARDKARTIEVLGAAGVPVPRTERLEHAGRALGQWVWPTLVKPVAGSASRGIAVAHSPADIRVDYGEAMLVQELLNGPEYTINLYIGENGRMLSAIPHHRLAVRAGEVEKGRTVRSQQFIDLAENVARALPGARGVLCFQLIDDRKRGPCVFEVNARFGGGYPLADRAGGRFAESLMARLVGRPECATFDWREGMTMIRYDTAVFDDRP